MKVKCDSIVRCGNYNCTHNCDGYFCNQKVVALNTEGKCALCRPKPTVKPKSEPTIAELVPPLD